MGCQQSLSAVADSPPCKRLRGEQSNIKDLKDVVVDSETDGIQQNISEKAKPLGDHVYVRGGGSNSKDLQELVLIVGACKDNGICKACHGEGKLMEIIDVDPQIFESETCF